MKFEEFLGMPDPQFREFVYANGPRVIVFPINGTRRWFMLEHPDKVENFAAAYLETATQRYIEVFKLIFDHGIHTLLTPTFGPHLLGRGEAYLQMAAEGLAQITIHPSFVAFYKEYDVRVRFYGDYKKFFSATKYAYLIDLFDQLTEKTQKNKNCRLFWGLFANDATESVAKISVTHYQLTGKIPDKNQIVTNYYGEYVEPVDLFIGFDKLAVFDMPLISTGHEDLYFTVSPSLYVNHFHLRSILYDHLFSRRMEEDYTSISSKALKRMRQFYKVNRDNILGIGFRQTDTSWYPLTQIAIPSGFSKAAQKYESPYPPKRIN